MNDKLQTYDTLKKANDQLGKTIDKDVACQVVRQKYITKYNNKS